MASLDAVDVDGLLCLVTSLRTHCACQQLLFSVADWYSKRCFLKLRRLRQELVEHASKMSLPYVVSFIKRSIKVMMPLKKLWPPSSILCDSQDLSAKFFKTGWSYVLVLHQSAVFHAFLLPETLDLDLDLSTSPPKLRSNFGQTAGSKPKVYPKLC